MSDQPATGFDEIDIEEEPLEDDDHLVWSDPGVLSDVELPDTDDEVDEDNPQLPEIYDEVDEDHPVGGI